MHLKHFFSETQFEVWAQSKTCRNTLREFIHICTIVHLDWTSNCLDFDRTKHFIFNFNFIQQYMNGLKLIILCWYWHQICELGSSYCPTSYWFKGVGRVFGDPISWPSSDSFVEQESDLSLQA